MGKGILDYTDKRENVLRIYGSDGWMSLDMRGCQIYRGEDRKLAQEFKHTEHEEWDTTPHVQNFLKAVRSRNRHRECRKLAAKFSSNRVRLTRALAHRIRVHDATSCW